MWANNTLITQPYVLKILPSFPAFGSVQAWRFHGICKFASHEKGVTKTENAWGL